MSVLPLEVGGPEAGTTDSDTTSEVVITVCPDGPLLVRGPVRLLDSDDMPIDPRRRTIALCRCGKSGIRPFCDGSHRHGFRCDGHDSRRPPVSGEEPPPLG